jgi:predicted permease
MEAAKLESRSTTPGLSPDGSGGRRNRLGVNALRKVARSPLVVASIVGLVLRGILGVAHWQLPVLLSGTLGTLADTFNGAALVTLGLSLRMQPTELVGQRVTAVCLLLSKFVLAPLLMRLMLELFLVQAPLDQLQTDTHKLLGLAIEAKAPASTDDPMVLYSFVMLYGILPSAPTVVVFAREYGESSVFLAGLQLVGLFTSVPFLLLVTIFIEGQGEAQITSLASLVEWVALVSTALSLAFAASLVITRRKVRGLHQHAACDLLVAYAP